VPFDWSIVTAKNFFPALFLQVRTEEELIEAIATATGAKKDCLCFIEIIVHKDDTSKELLEWGSRVSAANSRPPNPQ
jgi:pyruvate decarboxylase